MFAAVGNGEIFGTVQLELAAKQNAQHRAEVQKLMVHSKHRKKGIAKALMDQMEAAARETGRTLLVLDTLEGDTAERLYEKWNYQRAGSIPQYARCADGKLHPTVLFYKFL